MKESAYVEGMAIRLGGATGCSAVWDLSLGEMVPTYVFDGVCDKVRMLVDLLRDASAFGSRDEVSTKSR